MRLKSADIGQAELSLLDYELVFSRRVDDPADGRRVPRMQMSTVVREIGDGV
jgi:hypothetical protein